MVDLHMSIKITQLGCGGIPGSIGISALIRMSVPIGNPGVSCKIGTKLLALASGIGRNITTANGRAMSMPIFLVLVRINRYIESKYLMRTRAQMWLP